MKNKIKKFAAAIAAVSLLGTASLSVSATTADDVVAAARGAGFLEEYVQTLQNFLNTSNYTSDQYDVMIGMLSSAGEEMDDVAMQYFGKTVAEMKGEAQKEAEESGKEFDDSFLKDIADKMTNENVVEIIDQMVAAGKELGLEVTAEKKGDKSYIITVKDKDGNVQLVTPIGKLVDTTGADAANGIGGVIAVSSAITVVGCAGVCFLTYKIKKNEE